MIKVGRITSAFILVVVGIMLLYDQMADTNYLGYVLDWWPSILILLGIEYLWVNLKHHKSDKQLRLDIGGVLIAVIIVIGVIGVTQNRWVPTQWFNGMNWESIVKGELGKPFDMSPTTVPFAEKTGRVVIDNPYGSVILQSGDVNQIEIKRTVWVNRSDDKGAKEIADGTRLDYAEGSTLTISSLSEVNKFARRPTIELVVTVPSQQKVDWLIKGKNGKIEASKIPVKETFEVDTTNGSIALTELQGKLTAHSTNSAIKAVSIQGSVQLTTSNGSITVQDIAGDADLKTSNSSVTAERVSGQIKAHSSNGKINVNEVGGSLEAESTNSGISIVSRKVGGNWDLETTNGKIDVMLPSDGNYEVKAEGRSASSNLPLTVTDKRIEGKIGTGQYKIKADTSNSSISFQRAD